MVPWSPLFGGCFSCRSEDGAALILVNSLFYIERIFLLEDDQSPEALIRDVLEHIEDYQALVDKNRDTAERIGSWDVRMKWLMEELREEYDV